MPTHPQVFIVTGSSRGMGEAIALQLLQNPEHRVLGIARQSSAALEAAAQRSGAALTQWQQDLSDPVPAAQRLRDWLRALPAGTARVTLINNAALLNAPGSLADESLQALSKALRVSLEATLLLSAALLESCRDADAQLRILNISSGLGRRAMAGSAPYCAAKAGMDHLSRAMALDEAHRAELGLKAARIVSLAPGVIDTDMQLQLRSASPERFPEQQRFAGLKSQQQLSSPEAAAAAVLRYLDREEFGSQTIADVREA